MRNAVVSIVSCVSPHQHAIYLFCNFDVTNSITRRLVTEARESCVGVARTTSKGHAHKAVGSDTDKLST